MIVQTLLLGSSPLPRPRWRQTGRGRAISSLWRFFSFIPSLLPCCSSCFLSSPFPFHLFFFLTWHLHTLSITYVFLSSVLFLQFLQPFQFPFSRALQQGKARERCSVHGEVLVTPPRCQLRPPTPAPRCMARPDKHYYRGASVQDPCHEDVAFTTSPLETRECYWSSSRQILLIR